MFQVFDADSDISADKRTQPSGEEQKLFSIANREEDLFSVTKNGDIKSKALNNNDLLNSESASYYFNGTNAFLELTEKQTFSFTRLSNDIPFTFIITFNQSKLSNLSNDENDQFRKVLISKFNSSGAREWIVYTNEIRLYAQNSDSYICLSVEDEFEYERNYTIAFTYDGSKTANGLNVFVNGQTPHLTQRNTVGSYYGQTSTTTSVRMGTTVSSTTDSFKGKIISTKIFNRTLSKDEVINYSFGGLSYEDISATNNDLIEGPLVVGKRYRIQTLGTFDDFLHVGASSNATGVEFVATGTTPANWTNGSILRRIGCIADFNSINVSSKYWLDTQSNLFAMSTNAQAINISSIAAMSDNSLKYLGEWNASTNTPHLQDGTGITGDTYRVSVSGTQDLGSGVITFIIADLMMYNGSTWQKVAGNQGQATYPHPLISSQTHTVTGLTAGTFIAALTPTTYGFLAIRSVHISDATSLNTPSVIVSRDSQGGFSAGEISPTSLKINNTYITSPVLTNDQLYIQRSGTNNTVVNISAPPQTSAGIAKNSSLFLNRGTNKEYSLSLYNRDSGSVDAGNYMDFGSPEMGMTLIKSGTGVYTTFNISYNDGTNTVPALQVLPGNTTGTTNDTTINVVNKLTVGNSLVVNGVDLLNNNSITKEPTGFTNNENITVSYNSTDGTITLTGTFSAYWRGSLITVLTNGWVSPSLLTTYPSPVTGYFLYYNGTSFIWSNSRWTTDMLQIAYVYYRAIGTYLFCLKETHGFMQWQVHDELHNTIGTYKYSGGTFYNYVLDSTTLADRRPFVYETVVKDEDLATTLPALTTNSYTVAWMDGASITSSWYNYNIVLALGTIPYYNLKTGGVWTQDLMSNNSYMCVWVIAMPVASDSDSQRYRYFFLQGQSNSGLLEQQALSPGSLDINGFRNISPEFVYIAKIIIKYSASNWTIQEIDYLIGATISQISSSSSGTGLTEVSVDDTLSGRGTMLEPLSVESAPNVQVVTTTNSNCSVALFEATSGTISLKTNAGIKYDAENDILKVTNIQTTNPLAIDYGGTGQATKQAAFDALSPLSAKGDILYHDGSHNVKLSVGVDNQILKLTSGAPAWADESVSSGTGTDIGINFVNGQFETTATGWNTYKDAIQATPVDGTGGSSTLTAVRNTTTPLFGVGDLLITKTAANLQGEGVSYDFTIDTGNTGRVLTVSFAYKIASGTYTDNDMGMYLYDKTNAALIPLSIVNLPGGGGSVVQYQATFIPSTSLSYRLIFHTQVSTASAFTMRVDNVVVSTQRQLVGFAGTTWQGFTPTIDGAGTLSTANFAWRRIGSNMEVTGRCAVGSVTAVPFRFYIPSGYTIDTSVTYCHPSVGNWSRNSATLNAEKGGSILYGGGANFVSLTRKEYAVATSPFTELNTSALVNSSDTISVSFSIPITQWGVNVNLATDFTEYASNSSSTDASDTSSFVTGSGGSTGILGTTTITAARTKRIQFSRPLGPTDLLTLEIYSPTVGQWYPIYVTQNLNINYVYQNGFEYGIRILPVSGSTTLFDVYFALFASPTGATYASNGKGWGDALLLNSKWRVRKTSNGNFAEVPPLVKCTAYTGSTQTTFTNTPTIVNWSSAVGDTLSGFTTGAASKYTCKMAGEYQIQAHVSLALTNSNYNGIYLNLYKNGSMYKRLDETLFINAASTPVAGLGGVFRENMVAGDYYDVRIHSDNNVGSNTTADAGLTYNYIQYTRLGN